MSKLITLDQLKTFAANVKTYVGGKSKTVDAKTFSVKLQLPCYCAVVGKASSGDNILNSIICIDDNEDGIVVNSGKIQINKISRNGGVFQIECSASVYYVISSSELTSNPSSPQVLENITFIDNTTTESAPVQSDVEFSIQNANGSTQTYPQVTSFDSIYAANHLDHPIKFRLADSGVVEDGYTLTESEVLIQSSADSTVASQDTLGKIKVDGDFSKDATKLPVKLENNYAYVTLPTSIFTYKGQHVGKVDDISNPRVGDVWTVKENDGDVNGSEYIYVNKGTDKEPSYYWEYLGKKVEFDQTQADWNETDTSSKAYIKNKPVLFKKERLNNDKILTLDNVFGITDNNIPTTPIECEMLFYNYAELEVTVTPDASWKNMQSSDTEIKIPAGKYAEYVFTYWPGEGNMTAVVTYNGAIQP